MPYCHKRVISFLLTTRCNMACKYCYGSRKKEYNKLDMRFAKCALDAYVATGKINGVRFFADGEPTTEMGLIREICEYSRKINPNVHFEIQTNGFFSLEVAEWLAQNMDETWISMDLLPDTHDMFRVTKTGNPTSPIIERNIKFFRDYPNRRSMFGVRSTITNYNIDRQKEGIEYLNSLGVKYIWVDPIFPPVNDADEKEFEAIDNMHFARTFVDARAFAKTLDVFYESNFTSNFDGTTCYNCRSCLPMPHLTVDGYVSACEMCTYGENAGNMSVFIYGKYNAQKDIIEYDNEKIAVLQRRELKNMPDCQDCIVKDHCAGFCLGETQNEMGSLFKIKGIVCEPMRYIYTRIGNDYGEHGGEFKYKHP